MERLRRLLGHGSSGDERKHLYKKHTMEPEELAHELSRLVPKGAEASVVHSAAGQHGAASNGTVQLTVRCFAGLALLSCTLSPMPNCLRHNMCFA